MSKIKSVGADLQNRCPNCGSAALRPTEIHTEELRIYQRCECTKCKATWADVYHLIGYEDLEVPPENDLLKRIGVPT